MTSQSGSRIAGISQSELKAVLTLLAPLLDGSNLAIVPVAGAGALSSGNLFRPHVLTGSSDYTVGLPAVVNFSDGASWEIQSKHFGVVTIDPSGSETIDGALTLPLYYGQRVRIYRDGPAWGVTWLDRSPIISVTNIVASASNSIQLPAGYSGFEISMSSFRVSTTNIDVAMRLATDGVPSFISSTTYGVVGMYNRGGGTVPTGYGGSLSSAWTVFGTLDDLSGAYAGFSKVDLDVLTGNPRGFLKVTDRQFSTADILYAHQVLYSGITVRPTHFQLFTTGGTVTSGRVTLKGIP